MYNDGEHVLEVIGRATLQLLNVKTAKNYDNYDPTKKFVAWYALGQVKCITTKKKLFFLDAKHDFEHEHFANRTLILFTILFNYEFFIYFKLINGYT